MLFFCLIKVTGCVYVCLFCRILPPVEASKGVDIEYENEILNSKPKYEENTILFLVWV